MKNRFSVASYSFHGLHGLGAMTVFQYLETIRYRYHLDTADIWNGMLASYEEDYLQLLRQQMEERGVTLANLCCDGCHVWGETPEERGAQEELAMKCLRAAEILGAQTVRIDAGVRETAMSTQQLDYVSAKYDQYCARAAEFGAKLGPENHWGATTNAVELRKLFDAVTAKNFGILLHLGNWANTDNVEDNYTGAARVRYNAEFAPKAFHTHIMYEVCREAEEQLPPIVKAGYKGVWSVESHKSTNEYNNVAFQLAEARRVIEPCDYSSFVPKTIPDGAK